MSLSSICYFFDICPLFPKSSAHIHIKSKRRDKIPTSPNGGTNIRQMGEQITAKWGSKIPPNGGILFFLGSEMQALGI